MITQETTLRDGELMRVYTFINPAGGCRIATVNTRGHVAGYLSAIAHYEGVADYVNLANRSTNEADRLAIAYVKGA